MGYWVDPDGNPMSAPLTHADSVLDNHEMFGLTHTALSDLGQLYNQKFGGRERAKASDNAETIINGMAIRNGWVRVLVAWNAVYFEAKNAKSSHDTIQEIAAKYPAKTKFIIQWIPGSAIETTAGEIVGGFLESRQFDTLLAEIEEGHSLLQFRQAMAAHRAQNKGTQKPPQATPVDLDSTSGWPTTRPSSGESSGSPGGSWLSPTGQEHKVVGEHSRFVFNNPEVFGYTRDDVSWLSVAETWEAAIGDKKWIRVRDYSGYDGNSFFNLTVPDMSQGTKDRIWDWARNQADRDMVVYIDPYAGYMQWGRKGYRTTIAAIVDDFYFGEGKS
jgi:hypothetical protein